MKTLRIVFTLLSAILIALVIPTGALYSWTMAGICAIGALLFFFLMRLCKQKQEEDERQARHADSDEIPSGEKADKQPGNEESGKSK